jgi:hypothetical protein
MTGIADFNFPAFNRAAERLRELGHEIINPAELPDERNGRGSWPEYLRRDLRELMECEALALLDGWQTSRGATLELVVAQSLGMDIYNYSGAGLGAPFGFDIRVSIELPICAPKPLIQD